MIASFVISGIIYVVFVGISLSIPNRVGNLFTVLGVIWAGIMSLYSLGNITSEIWVAPTIAGIIHLTVCLLFCYMIRTVIKTKKVYKHQNGYNIVKEQIHPVLQTNQVAHNTDRSVEDATSKVVCEEKMKYEINDLHISIGTANIHFIDKNKIYIRIQNCDGRVYVFKTSGNLIASIKAAGRPEMEYGRSEHV